MGEPDLKILFLAKNVTLCGRSGDAVHVRELVRELSKLDTNIVLVGRDLQGMSDSSYEEYQDALKELREDKKTEIILMSSRAKLSFPTIRDLQALKCSFRALRKRDIDLIYSRSFNAYLEVFLMKLFQIPLVLEINGLEFEERRAVAGSKGMPGTSIMKNLARICFGHATKTIAVTSKIKSQLQAEFGVKGSRISVVSNGVNERFFSPAPSNTKLISTLKIKPGSNVVCFVGAFDPWHGLEGMVEAAVEVVKQEPKTVFLMVGDGIMRDRIERTVRSRKLQDNFIFTGRVPYNTVPAYINLSSICVIPFPGKNTHLKDSSPLKLYEYLSCGKPVVSTDVGGVSEVINRSGGGILVKPDDPHALAAGLLELLHNDAGQKKMGRSGRSFIVKKHTWHHTASKVRSVFESVLKKEPIS